MWRETLHVGWMIFWALMLLVMWTVKIA